LVVLFGRVYSPLLSGIFVFAGQANSPELRHVETIEARGFIPTCFRSLSRVVPVSGRVDHELGGLVAVAAEQ
jgi:hypothetical protein